MALIQNDDLVEAFLTNGANPAFRESISIWRPARRTDNRDVLGLEDCIERRWKLAVAVVAEEPCGDTAVLDLPAQVTCLLSHPRSSRVCGAAG